MKKTVFGFVALILFGVAAYNIRLHTMEADSMDESSSDESSEDDNYDVAVGYIQNNNLADFSHLLSSNNYLARHVNLDGWTLLHDAAFDGRMDFVLLLLAAGADHAKENNEGETAADWARDQGHEDVELYLRTYKK